MEWFLILVFFLFYIGVFVFLCVFFFFCSLIHDMSVRARWVERSTEIGARDGTGRTLRFAFSREEGRPDRVVGSADWFAHRSIDPFIHPSIIPVVRSSWMTRWLRRKRR